MDMTNRCLHLLREPMKNCADCLGEALYLAEQEKSKLLDRIAELEKDRERLDPIDRPISTRIPAVSGKQKMECKMPLTSEEIENRVNYHAPSPEGVARHRNLSDSAAHFLACIEVNVPDGREKSLAITKVEEAKMWASAGVARNPATV